MSIKELKEKSLEFIEKYPSKKEDIIDLYQLALDEIEEGGSESHECELAYNDMIETIKED